MRFIRPPFDDAATDESEAKIVKEYIDMREAEVYDDLADLEDVMFETVRQTSLRETTMVGSNAAGGAIEVTSGTDAQVQSVTAGTDASTHRMNI